MPDDDSRWLELRTAFHGELDERLTTLNSLLVQLEAQRDDDGQRAEMLRTLYREAHSLKGAARAVELPQVERLAHALESLLDTARAQERAPEPDWFASVYRALDALAGKETPADPRDIVQLTPARAPATESVRVAVEKLDVLLAQAGELAVTHIRIEQRQRELRQHMASLLRLIGRVDERAVAALQQVDDIGTQLRHDSAQLGAVTRAIEDEVMAIRLVPVDRLFGSFERMVRDLAHTTGKQVQLLVEGADTEIDRKILEQLRDPLVHMLRNAVDHGIESPEERAARGKPMVGTLRLSAAQRVGRVELRLEDDGAGLDPRRLRASAIAKGLMSADQAAALTDAEATDLIFRPGFSTTQVVSETSGRGVGMDVVREHVERLGGYIVVGGVLGQSASFTLSVPLTLATTRAVLIEHSGQLFGVPSTMVERSARLRLNEAALIRGRRTAIVDGHPLPLVELADAIDQPNAPNDSEWRSYIVLRQADIRVGILVEHIVGEQELVVKQLGWPLRRTAKIDGGAVLSSGKTVIILNPTEVLRAAWQVVYAGGAQSTRTVVSIAAPQQRKRRLLVVDDSLTTRTLERSIFEAAGYQVVVATDGLDALNRLNDESVDAVISDVEMPRMDGFALTAAIRRDDRLRHVPVVLVTSLEAREHRERGVAVGADAYIVKGRFDQGQLLETVGRLIAA